MAEISAAVCVLGPVVWHVGSAALAVASVESGQDYDFMTVNLCDVGIMKDICFKKRGFSRGEGVLLSCGHVGGIEPAKLQPTRIMTRSRLSRMQFHNSDYGERQRSTLLKSRYCFLSPSLSRPGLSYESNECAIWYHPTRNL